MDLISRGQNVSWEFKGQQLVVKDNRKYDKLLVAVKGIHGNPMPLHLENHYFDITKCNNMLGEDNKDEEKMRQMKSFLDEMLRQTEWWKTGKKNPILWKIKGYNKVMFIWNIGSDAMLKN